MRGFGLALTLAACACASALAQPGTPPPPGGPPRAEGAAQPGPQPVPVPDGPVLERREAGEGLIIEELRVGDGPPALPDAAVAVHYHGTLRSDGTVFDSSFQRGAPVAFPLWRVIEGWQRGVPGMRVGGIRRLIVPAALAYGPHSPSPLIPPNSDLVFTVQLLGVLQIEDLRVGEGDEASGQFCAVTAHTITDADGKVVEQADAAHPAIWIPLPGEFPGMMWGLEGMKVGGKRRILVPAEMNPPQASPQGHRPKDVPLTIDVELLAVRVLQPRQR